jgi:hypothetical protein
MSFDGHRTPVAPVVLSFEGGSVEDRSGLIADDDVDGGGGGSSSVTGDAVGTRSERSESMASETSNRRPSLPGITERGSGSSDMEDDFPEETALLMAVSDILRANSDRGSSSVGSPGASGAGSSSPALVSRLCELAVQHAAASRARMRSLERQRDEALAQAAHWRGRSDKADKRAQDAEVAYERVATLERHLRMLLDPERSAGGIGERKGGRRVDGDEREQIPPIPKQALRRPRVNDIPVYITVEPEKIVLTWMVFLARLLAIASAAVLPLGLLANSAPATQRVEVQIVANELLRSECLALPTSRGPVHGNCTLCLHVGRLQRLAFSHRRCTTAGPNNVCDARRWQVQGGGSARRPFRDVRRNRQPQANRNRALH